jgi:hypothetical protein
LDAEGQYLFDCRLIGPYQGRQPGAIHVLERQVRPVALQSVVEEARYHGMMKATQDVGFRSYAGSGAGAVHQGRPQDFDYHQGGQPIVPG